MNRKNEGLTNYRVCNIEANFKIFLEYLNN